MNYLWSSDQKQLNLINNDLAPIHSFCFHNKKVYAIQKNRLVSFSCEDGSKEEKFTKIEFIKAFAGYGRMFAISLANQLFVFDDDESEFQSLNILSTGFKCKHGTQVQYRLKILEASSTELSTIILDDSRQSLWTFQNSEIGNEKIYATQIELNSCAYSVRQFVTGRKHCAVLIDFVNTNQQDGETFHQTVSICEKCKEDTTLRLSKLMEDADEEFRDNSSTETELADILDDTPSTSQCQKPLSERSRIGLNQIFSSIKSPFSKTSTPVSRQSTKSQWYAIPTKESKPNEGDTDIELTTLGSERHNFVATTSVGLSGSIAFSFVSLENLLSSSDNSSRPDEELYNQLLFDQNTQNTSQLHSFVSDQIANTFCEVWCFGANDLGQLGIGSNIATRVPKRVKMPQSPVIKLSAGDNFVVALLASGEVYGWGANENNQLKLDKMYLAEPTQIKLGAKLCAIDVTAIENITYVGALSTENLNVVVCRFSKTHSKDSITRLDHLEKTCLALNIDAFGENLLVGNLPFTSENRERMQDSSKVVSKFLLSARTNLQLSHLAHNIKEKAERPTLNSLSTALWKWTSVLSQLAEHLRSMVFIQGNLKMEDTMPQNLTFDSIMLAFFKFHYSYLDSIADASFTGLNLSNEMQKSFEQLSYEFNTESSKEFKRIRALFGVPKREFFKLAPFISQLLKTEQSSIFWRRLENEIDQAEKWAKLTARNAELRPPNLPVNVLLAGFFEEPNFHVKSRSNSAPTVIRQFLGKQKSVLLIWTDSLNMIQNDSIIQMEYPLLRIERNAENPLIFIIKDPEITMEIEFSDSEIAAKFTELLNQAWEFSKSRLLFSRNIVNLNSTNSLFFESRLRYSKYTFSPFHTFGNAEYEGAWVDGMMHGKGKLTFPDGRQYTGKFANGQFHGFGELLTGTNELSTSITSNTSLMNSIFYTQPKNLYDLCHTLKGSFKNGQLNGLGTAYFLNGDRYDGYFRNHQMNGHGVYRTQNPPSTYVGAFRNNLRHGYAVLSSNTERYLGEWVDGKKQGLGTIITINGVYHEGKFEDNKFVNGQAFFETPRALDPTAIISYEGAFAGLEVAAGKGTLHLNKYDKIVGTFHGIILGSELAITNATYSHNNELTSMDSDFIMTCGPKHSQWTLHENKKWVELFSHFLEDELKITAAEFQQVLESDEQTPPELSKRAWNSLASGLSKIKQQKNITFDDRLERIPSCDEQTFSASYYATVLEYFSLVMANESHSLNRLLNGVAELFNCSYASVGSHVVMYDSAILEFQSLLARCYTVARILFVNLPPTHEMYSSVPNSADLHHDTESSDSSSSCTAETLSIGSLEDAITQNSPSNENSPRLRVLPPTETVKSNLLATPCCDFLIDYFFGACYADLFTLYSEKCQAADNRYWSRIMHLNSYTDSHLLRYFDVKGELWPTNFENVRELDTFTVRVSAKNKFYNSAVTKLQELSGTINPTNKLAILAETFFEITACTSKFSNVGPSHTWSIDELLPAFIYVVVRAQVQHLGAEIRLLHDFSPHVSAESSSEIALLFTILQSAYYNICVERGSP